MAKERNTGLLPMLGAIFCFFVVFMYCVTMLSSFSLGGLLMPALWLLLGFCLLTQKKSWLCVVGMLPLVILTVQSAWGPLALDSLKAFFNALLCGLMPALAFAFAWVYLLLACCGRCGKLRRGLWFLPMVLMLPACIISYTSILLWAKFGMIACVTFWLKPSGK